MIKIDFNKNWKFRKAGTDRPWRKLCLPHDAMLEEKRDPKCESGSAGAYFPGGIYEYEKWRFLLSGLIEKSPSNLNVFMGNRKFG